MTAIDILTLLLVTLVWGFNFAVVKIGLAQLPPILFVSLRFFLVPINNCDQVQSIMEAAGI